MAFTIVRNDITKMRVDAIVNTADPNPVIGAGTDAAVHAAAGPKLLAARQQIGAIPVGHAAETPAFDLPAKYVLHTVSPAWRDGAHGEPELLDRAYRSALTLSEQLHCRSVAFPLMASGSCGFPHELALDIAIRAFSEFLSEHDTEIVLVVFSREATVLAGTRFDDLRHYIDDRCAAEKTQIEYPYGLRDRRRKVREAAVPAEFARRADDMADASVCLEAEAPASAPVFANAARLEDFLQTAESSFSEHLISLLNECGEKDSVIYRRAQISRQLFHRILNETNYRPSKSTAIQLALALRLDLAGTQKLLEKAGFALTRSSKTDLVVQYFIERGEFNVITINAALFDCGLPLLKTGSVS